MQRYQCPIYNGTLNTFIVLKSVYFCEFLHCFLLRNAQVTFAEKPQMKRTILRKQNHEYLIHTWSDKASEGTVVNKALPSLQGRSLEI